MKCSKCGHENAEDANFCDNCGSSLKQPQNGSMTNTTKLLIVAVIVLVGALGLISGIMLTMNNAKPVNNQTNVSINQTNTQISSNAEWHQITSLSGSTNDYRTFQTKGNKFKVEFSAFPIKNYNTNFMEVQIGNSNGVLSSGRVEWSSMEDLITKSKIIEVTGPPGTYWIRINTKDLDNWKVTIYDFY